MLDTLGPPLLKAPPDSPTQAEVQGPLISMVWLRLLNVSAILFKCRGFKILFTRLRSDPETEILWFYLME